MVYLSCVSYTSHPQEADRRIKETEERERKNLSRVLLEERSWFCGFITAFGKVLVSCATQSTR